MSIGFQASAFQDTAFQNGDAPPIIVAPSPGTIFDLYSKSSGTKLKMWRGEWTRRITRGN